MTAFPFSSPTVGALVDAIATGYTAAQMGTLFLKADIDGWDPEQYPNKETRVQRLLRGMRNEASQEALAGALELARMVMADGSPWPGHPDGAVWWPALRDALEADGFEYDRDTQRLVSAIPGIEVAQETTALEQSLRDRGWTTAAGHYRQAVEALSAGHWASANAQVRTYLEDFIPSVAECVVGKRPGKVRAAIDQLQSKDVLVDGEYDFIKGLWKLCQPKGSHPGLSDHQEARFRLMTATAHSRFLLARLAD